MKFYLLFFIFLILVTNNLHASFVADCTLEVKVIKLEGSATPVKNSDKKFIFQKAKFKILKVISQSDDNICSDYVKKEFTEKIKTSDLAKIKVGKKINLFYSYESSEIVKNGMMVGTRDFHEWTILEDVKE